MNPDSTIFSNYNDISDNLISPVSECVYCTREKFLPKLLFGHFKCSIIHYFFAFCPLCSTLFAGSVRCVTQTWSVWLKPSDQSYPAVLKLESCGMLMKADQRTCACAYTCACAFTCTCSIQTYIYNVYMCTCTCMYMHSVYFCNGQIRGN